MSIVEKKHRANADNLTLIKASYFVYIQFTLIPQWLLKNYVLFLPQYAQMKPTPLEECEGLEQLRVLEYRFSIRVYLTQKTVLEIRN